MNWALPRTEKITRRAAEPVRGRGTSHRLSRGSIAHFLGRLACGLLAAMHVSPLLRVSRNIVEQGPTLPLLAAWGVLAVLIGVLTAKAAGLVFFRNGSRRLSLVTLIVACALFHGEVIVSVDAPKTIAILATAGGTVAVVSLAHRFREHLAGTGPAIADLFPMTLWARLSGEPATNPLCFVGLGASQPRGPPL